MRLVLLFLLIFSSVAYSQNGPVIAPLEADSKEGGNGQLVVIPEGHDDPVPYEAVRALETGRYRNYFKLPCINGNIERRAKFNKDYACHAQKWLELVKKLSPYLHEKLHKAAKTTHFRIVNEYIQWEHEPYPDGEIDYKKFEKAAFYNGEIILSTPVMDNVGPLNGKLTKEQNQGYIVFHELINAAFPDKTVVWKLNLGEIFIQKLIFDQPNSEVFINLGIVDLNMLDGVKDYKSLKDAFQELLLFVEDTNRKTLMEQKIFTIEEYLLTEKSYKDSYTDYLISQNSTDFQTFSDAHKNFLNNTLNSGLVSVDTSKIFTKEFYKSLMNTYNFDFSDLYKLEDDLLPNFKEATTLMRNKYFESVVIESLDKYKMEIKNNKFKIMYLFHNYFTWEQTEEHCDRGCYNISATDFGLNHYIVGNYDTTSWINNVYKLKFKTLAKKFLFDACKDLNVNCEKSYKLIKWMAKPQNSKVPLKKGDQIVYSGSYSTTFNIGIFKGVTTVDGELMMKVRTNRNNTSKKTEHFRIYGWTNSKRIYVPKKEIQ